MKSHNLLPLGLALFCSCNETSTPESPNFIVILVDDMGYGDIEPFGSTVNSTPNLNTMAQEGLTMTSCYAAPCSTPSRGSLMTGCYPKRVGLDHGEWKPVLFPKDGKGLNPEEITIAEVLKEEGYATACFGKWHLGDQEAFLPLNQGFDTYFGIPYSNDMWQHAQKSSTWKNPAPPLPLVMGNVVVDTVTDMKGQSQLCKIFTDASIEYIKENQDNPFFIYLAYPFIHHPRNAREEFIKKAGVVTDMDEYKMMTDQGYMLRERTRAQIEEVDWSVGAILNTLKELNLDSKTMVVFVSDNGGARGSRNAPLKGGKSTTWEGGMRVPCIYWWPGVIDANKRSDEITSLMDFLPTFSTLSGGSIPQDRIIDGKNIVPVLLQEDGARSPYEAFFYYQGAKLQAVRHGDWKLRLGKLYNLKEDIGETKDLSSKHPDIVAELSSYMVASREDLGNVENCRPAGYVKEPKYLDSSLEVK